jgi:hypothetical protein
VSGTEDDRPRPDLREGGGGPEAKSGPDEALRTRRVYCRRLGHDVPLAYCCRPGSDQPCRNLPGCWGGHFDVEAFLERNFTDEQIRRMHEPPPDKAATIFELMRRAQRRAAETPGEPPADKPKRG